MWNILKRMRSRIHFKSTNVDHFNQINAFIVKRIVGKKKRLSLLQQWKCSYLTLTTFSDQLIELYHKLSFVDKIAAYNNTMAMASIGCKEVPSHFL